MRVIQLNESLQWRVKKSSELTYEIQFQKKNHQDHREMMANTPAKIIKSEKSEPKIKQERRKTRGITFRESIELQSIEKLRC